MSKIRIQPHLTASRGSVSWAGWYLATESERRQLGVLLDGWDYDQAITIGTAPEIDALELSRSTGIDDLSEIHMVVAVDCPPTSRRFLSHLSVSDYLAAQGRFVGVEVPPGAVALELKLSCHLVLMADRPALGHVASVKGSRLAESPTTRLILEGDASRFPTEALSFADMRWEPAAWSVRIDLDDMNDAFTGAVRLMLNTDHPVGSALAGMEPRTYGALGSVLRIDIVRSVLVAAIERVGRRGLAAVEFDEDTFGSVAEQMSNDYFGMALAGVAEMKASDSARFERVLQAQVGMEVQLP